MKSAMENGEDFKQNDSEFAAMEIVGLIKPDFEVQFKRDFFQSALRNGELQKLNSEDDFKRLWSRLKDALDEKKRELKRIHKLMKLAFETNPEKCLCIHHFYHDDSSKFLPVDMKTGKLSLILSSKDMMQNNPVSGSLDSMVYNAYHSKKDEDVELILKGLCFDVRSPDLGSVDLEFSSVISRTVSYKSSIYAFNRTSFEAEFYNFTQNPPTFKRLPVSNWPQNDPDFKIIPDSCSDRILFFFRDRGLYALYPEEKEEELSFTCLDPDIPVGWYNSTLSVIDDGVIYFLSEFPRKPPVVAYDLEKKKLLDVEWESGCDSWGVDALYVDSTRLFNLGNGILCLAYYEFSSSEVTALYFKVEKHPSRESIVATLGPSYKFEISAYLWRIGFFVMKADD